ncbi:MAG TPA: hypothetical protein VGI70_12115 [Polyangiales bacterium]|jgi:S1-C subfamily serine protease
MAALSHNKQMRVDVRMLGLVVALCAVASTIAADDVPPAADGGVPLLKLHKRTLESLAVDPELGREVNAGVIPRPALHAELSRGIGQFLRQVRAEPALLRGRFIGWRLLQLYLHRSDIHVLVLRVGDTVTKVNGQPIEHPEDFKTIWDSLDRANELVLDIERGGKPTKLRYTIAD